MLGKQHAAHHLRGIRRVLQHTAKQFVLLQAYQQGLQPLSTPCPSMLAATYVAHTVVRALAVCATPSIGSNT